MDGFYYINKFAIMSDQSPAQSDTPSAYLALLSPSSVSATADSTQKCVLLQSVSTVQYRAKRRVLQVHMQLKEAYVAKGVSYLRQRFLSHLVTVIHHPTLSNMLIYRRLNYFASELLMHELEIATWVSFALSLKTEDYSNDADELLLFLAYTAKKRCCSSEDGEMWDAVCEKNVAGFIGKYLKWTTVTTCIQPLSLQELNSLIVLLTHPVGAQIPVCIDYNAQVKSLLNENDSRS